MFCLKFCHRYVSVVVARSGYVVQPRPSLGSLHVVVAGCCLCTPVGCQTNVHSPLRLWTWTPF